MPDVPVPHSVGTNNSETTAPLSLSRLWPLIIFWVISVAGLFFVKWNPYYHKALIAATKHSIGTSILSGNAPVPPAPSWQVAWNYTAIYFKSVWQAVLLGLIMASLIETLFPKVWLQRFLGSGRYRSTALGGIAAIPSMMCTCCAAPVAVGMRKQSVSVGAALAYWLGNPVLNPATLVFMAFILSWQLVALRLVIGLVMVFGMTYVANLLAGEETVTAAVASRETPSNRGNLPLQWLKSFCRLALDSLPIYFLMVLLLGAFRAWLFPAINPEWANSYWVIIAFALAGTLFIIPTAAEIPIVQTMLSFGMGIGPAAALLITLPAISLPSLFIVRKAFPTRILLFTSMAVATLGILSGILAKLFF